MTEIKIEDIVSNPNQPRKHFDSRYIKELGEDIKKRGLLQPIKVRPHKGKYEIVFGECRYRACKLIQKPTIDCIIEELTDQEAFVQSFSENYNRQNLSPIDEALAMLKLSKKQREIASLMNISEIRVSQKLALLDLPTELHPFFYSFCGFKPLSEAHGRQLLSFKKFLDKGINGSVGLGTCMHYTDRTEGMFLDRIDAKNKEDVIRYFTQYIYPTWKDGKQFNPYHTNIGQCVLYDMTKYAYVEGWSVSHLEESIDGFKFDMMYCVFKSQMPSEAEVVAFLEKFEKKHHIFKDWHPKREVDLEMPLATIPIVKYSTDDDAEKTRDEFSDMRNDLIDAVGEGLYNQYQDYLNYKNVYDKRKKYDIKEAILYDDEYMPWFFKQCHKKGWFDDDLATVSQEELDALDET